MTSQKKILFLLVLSTFYGATSVLCAQEFSLSKCLELAQTRSLQEVEASLQEVKAKAEVAAANSRRLPQLSIVGQYSTSDDLTTQLPDDNQALLKLEQNLLPFFSPDWIRGGQSQALFRASQTDHMASREDVDLLVKQLYFSTLRDEDIVSQVDQVTKEYQTLLDYLAPQFTVGGAPRFDAVKVKVSLSDLARSRALALAQLAGEKSGLAQVLGLNTSDELEIKTITVLPKMPDLPTDALDGNPSLQALAQRVQATKIGLDADNFSRLPSLTVDFRYGYTAPTWNSLSRSWDATVQMSLPLFDGGLINAQTDSDRADWKMAQNDLEIQRHQISSQLVESQAESRAYWEDQKRLEILLPETEKASHSAIGQYRRGAMGIVETTDAVNLWLQTSLNERNAYYSYLISLAQMERLTGEKMKVQYE